MADREPPHGKTSDMQRKFFILLSGIPRTSVLLFYIDFQLAPPQYRLVCTSIGESPPLMCSANPGVCDLSLHPGPRGDNGQRVGARGTKGRTYFFSIWNLRFRNRCCRLHLSIWKARPPNYVTEGNRQVDTATFLPCSPSNDPAVLEDPASKWGSGSWRASSDSSCNAVCRVCYAALSSAAQVF